MNSINKLHQESRSTRNTNQDTDYNSIRRFNTNTNIQINQIIKQKNNELFDYDNIEEKEDTFSFFH